MKDLVKKVLNGGKKSVKERFNYQNLKETLVNVGLVWSGFKVSSVTCAFFGGELNRYNTDEHLMAGAGIGTLFGGGVYGFLVSTAGNILWEVLENKRDLYGAKDSPVNLITDVMAIYVGTMILAPLIEKGKEAIEYRMERGKEGLLRK